MIPFVLLVLVVWTFMLQRTRLGRYIYAVGANPEAARRAGINVRDDPDRHASGCAVSAPASPGSCTRRSSARSRPTTTAARYVLFAVAAAVIGGTSLFGGRGKPVHSLLGGLIIAVVTNGLALMSVNAAVTDIVDRGRVARRRDPRRACPAPGNRR